MGQFCLAPKDMTAFLLLFVEQAEGRDRRIGEFQQFVWRTRETPLEFNEEECASYYGEERLVREIHKSLAKLSNLTA